MLAIIHAFKKFSEKIEFTKLNLKIEFHEPLNGSWKVLGCNTGFIKHGKRHRTGVHINITYFLQESLARSCAVSSVEGRCVPILRRE